MRYVFTEWHGGKLDLLALCGWPLEPVNVTIVIPRGARARGNELVNVRLKPPSSLTIHTLGELVL